MKNMKTILAAISAVAFSGAPIAFAGSHQLVPMDVDLSVVKNDIARNINADVSRIPEIVAAPVDVAAKVCNVPADTLREQVKNDSGGCTAESTSAALEGIVREAVNRPGQQ